MADIKKGANEPFLYDDQTDRITGLKNSDSTEKKFVYTDGSSGPVVIADTLTVGGATSTKAITASVESSATAVAVPVVTVRAESTGTPASGFGAGIVFDAEYAPGTVATAGSIATFGRLFTAGTERSDLQFSVRSNNTLSNIARLELASGSTGSLRMQGTGSNSLELEGSSFGQVISTASLFLTSGSATDIIIRPGGTEQARFTSSGTFRIAGDTMRITGTRTPASNAAGTAGDFTFGTDGGTTYLYYCIASGNWGRVALTTGY